MTVIYSEEAPKSLADQLHTRAQTLADELAAWRMAHPGTSCGSSLKLLESVLRQHPEQGSWDAWADVDVRSLAALDHSEAAIEHPWALRLDSVKTVLVFVPLLVTWMGLFFATRAYEDLVDRRPEAAQVSFLKLWQSGFEGTSFFSLDRLALVTFACISLLILVSLLADAVRRARARRYEQQTPASETLDFVLLRTQLLLSQYRLGTPARFREEITRVASSFTSVAANVEGAVVSATGLLDQLQIAASRADAGFGRIENAVITSGNVVERLEQVSARHAERLEEASLEGASRFEEASLRQTDRFAEACGRQLERLEEVAQRQAAQAGESSTAVIAAVEQFTQRIDQTAETLDRTVMEVEKRSSAASVAVAEVLAQNADRHADALLESAVAISDTNRRLSGAADTLYENTARLVEKHLDQMSARVSELRDEHRIVVGTSAELASQQLALANLLHAHEKAGVALQEQLSRIGSAHAAALAAHERSLDTHLQLSADRTRELEVARDVVLRHADVMARQQEELKGVMAALVQVLDLVGDLPSASSHEQPLPGQRPWAELSPDLSTPDMAGMDR